jgi:hypothetical protein
LPPQRAPKPKIIRGALITTSGGGGGGTNCGFHDIPAVPTQYARDWRRNTQYQPPPGPHPLPKVQSRYPSWTFAKTA